jgi:hypothetical protein
MRKMIPTFLLVFSLTGTELKAQDFQITSKMGPNGSADHLVVITVVDNKGYVDYPDLGCSGELITPAHVKEILPYLKKSSTVTFSEFIQGADCPTGGNLTIQDWDGRQYRYRIVRSGGSGSLKRWTSVPVKLELQDISITAKQEENSILPDGTIAGNPAIGLFLGEGPSIPGFGPTSIVTGVTSGSVAEIFGLQQRDQILMVGSGAGMPAGHIKMITQDLERQGATRLTVRRGSESEIVIKLLLPENSNVLSQLSKAARNDLFGPANDRVSFRLRLMTDGAFEALDFLARADYATIPRYGGGFWDRTLTKTANGNIRYDHFVAAYGTARYAFLGHCDDSVISMIATGGSLSTTKIGTVTVQTTDTRYEQVFEALAPFASIIQRTKFDWQPGVFGFNRVAHDFGPVFEKITCDSIERIELEDNLHAYANRTVPVHVH